MLRLGGSGGAPGCGVSISTCLRTKSSGSAVKFANAAVPSVEASILIGTAKAGSFWSASEATYANTTGIFCDAVT